MPQSVLSWAGFPLPWEQIWDSTGYDPNRPHYVELIMKQICRFSVRNVEETHARAVVSELLDEQLPTGVFIRGRQLEYQAAVDDYFVLLLTDNIPFEETLIVELLGPHLERWDHVELGAPYQPGMLRDISIVGERTIWFTMFGNDRWELTAQPRTGHASLSTIIRLHGRPTNPFLVCRRIPS